MTKNNSKRNRLITVIVVAFMVFSMILFTVAGVISSFGIGIKNNQSNTDSNNSNILKITKTDIINYTPTNISSETKKESGYCFASSASDPQNVNAFRCMVQNNVLDPCFLIPSSTNLLCNVDFQNPNQTSSFILQNIKPLPKFKTVSSTNILGTGILLADGTYCSSFTDTLPFSSTSNGYKAYYSCISNDLNEEYIFNEINTSTPIWEAIVGSLSKSTSTYPPLAQNLKLIQVKTVWR